MELTLQPISFWPFAARSIAKAAELTMDFFGWNLKTLITSVLLTGAGIGLYFLVRGASEALRQWKDLLLLIVIPAILFFAGLFVFNIFRAPYLIYMEEYGKAQTKISATETAKQGAEDARKIAEDKVLAQQTEIDNLKNELKKGRVATPASQGYARPGPTFSDTEKIVLAKGLQQSRGSAIRIVTVGGTDATAISSQIQDAFREAGWAIQADVIGSLNVTVAGGTTSGRVELEGLYLIAAYPQSPAVQTIVSSFEMSRHAVSLNGSAVLRSRADITLYIIYGNKPPS